MKPIVKVLIFLAVFGVVGVAVWYFTKEKPAAAPETEPPPVPIPPAQLPPTGAQNALVDPTTGTGLAAINRRIGEILTSDEWKPLQDSARDEVNIISGVTASKQNYYSSNIARPPITSAKKIPLKVKTAAKSALEEFTTVDGNLGYSTTTSLRTANRLLMEELGTCYVGDRELASQDDFNKLVICQELENCGNNFKKMGDKIGVGGSKVAADMKLMSKHWLDAIEIFESMVRVKAIEDLRANGWKFFGFDF